MKPCSLPPHASPIFLSGTPVPVTGESRRGLPLAGLSTRVFALSHRD